VFHDNAGDSEETHESIVGNRIVSRFIILPISNGFAECVCQSIQVNDAGVGILYAFCQ